MTEAECQAFRDLVYPTYTFWTSEATLTPRGCSVNTGNSHVYHRDIHSRDCGTSGFTCVSKTVSDRSYELTSDECQLYAGSSWHLDVSRNDRPTGCYLKTENGLYYYNHMTTNLPCSTTYPCPQKQRKFLEVTSGIGDKSVTFEECMDYGRRKGYVLDTEIWDNTANPRGCNIWAPVSGSTTNRVKYNPSTTSTVTCAPQYHNVACVIKERQDGSTLAPEIFTYGGDTNGCVGGDYHIQSDGSYYCQSCDRYLVLCNSDNAYRCQLINGACKGYFTKLPKDEVEATEDLIKVTEITESIPMGCTKLGTVVHYQKHGGEACVSDCVINEATDCSVDGSTVEVSSGLPDLSMTKEDCQNYATTTGRTFNHEPGHFHYAMGCSRYYGGGADAIYWSENPAAAAQNCGANAHNCIQRNYCTTNVKFQYSGSPLSESQLTERQCNNYAGERFSHVMTVSDRPLGCWRHGSTYYYNFGVSGSGTDCSSTYVCLVSGCTDCAAGSHYEASASLKMYGMPDNSMSTGECQAFAEASNYYYITKNENNDLCDSWEESVPKEDCINAASQLGLSYTSTSLNNVGTHAHSGCFVDSGSLYYFDNLYKEDNYQNPSTYYARQYLCYRSYTDNTATTWLGSADSPNEPSGCISHGGGVQVNTLNTDIECSTAVQCVEQWSQCDSCGQDEFQSLAGQTTCVTCPDGHESFDANGQFTNVGATQCIACDATIEYDDDGEAHTACIATLDECGPGFYFTETAVTEPNTCTPCAVFVEYKEGTNAVTSCTPHPTCPVGQGRTNALVTTESVQCALCPAGQYSDSDSTDECIVCPAGSVTNTLTATGATTCTEVADGYYSPNSQTEPVVCAAGTFDHDGDSTTACQVCPAGSVTNTLTATGATACTECPLYHFSTVSTQACTTWTVCNTGEIKVDATTSSDGQCTKCPAGEYVDSSCDICPYKTECIVCPAGSVTNTLADTGASTCTECAVGTFSPESTTACAACDPGNETDAVTGASTCTACVAGKYDHDSDVSTGCVACPADEASTSGQTSCTPCDEHSAGKTYVTERNSGTGDFSMTSAECDTESSTDSFENVSDTTKPSGCVKDTSGGSDSYLYNVIKTDVACSNDNVCVAHAADIGSTECVTCSAGSWKNNDVCKRWSYRDQDDCTGGGAFVTGSTVQDSYCTPPSYIYEEVEPSDRSFDLSIESVLCGDDYALLDQQGNIVCKPCDRSAFLSVYRGAITTDDVSRKHGSCCINSHHHVCIEMLEEFKRKCGTSFVKGQSSCV